MLHKIIVIFLTLVLIGLVDCSCTLSSEDVSGPDSADLTGISDELLASNPKKRISEFLISVTSVMEKLERKEGLVLVDVRSREEFRKFRIPGSMNVPLFAVKTKAFLKSRPLVLINEGRSYSLLEQECKKLRAAGYNVRILHGGLNHWTGEKAPIEGDVFAPRDLNIISPRTFYGERNYDDWIVLNVSKSSVPEAKRLIRQTIHVPYSGDPQGFLSRLKKVTDGHRHSLYPYVLIFSQKGEAYKEIQKLVRETGTKNVFYMKGGLDAYKNFLHQQSAMWKPGTHSKKSMRKCPSCP